MKTFRSRIRNHRADDYCAASKSQIDIINMFRDEDNCPEWFKSDEEAMRSITTEDADTIIKVLAEGGRVIFFKKELFGRHY